LRGVEELPAETAAYWLPALADAAESDLDETLAVD
jgi:hypothetical protein